MEKDIKRETLGSFIKDVLGDIASKSEGKEKLQVETILLDFEIHNTAKQITERITKIQSNALSEEQYAIIKDSLTSIKAEYSKILNILGGEVK